MKVQDAAVRLTWKDYKDIPSGHWVLWQKDQNGSESIVYHAKHLKTLIPIRDNHAKLSIDENWPYIQGGYNRMYIKGE